MLVFIRTAVSGMSFKNKVAIVVLNLYLCCMKNLSTKGHKTDQSLREQILNSMIASFKIEGIDISIEVANAKLKKVINDLGK